MLVPATVLYKAIMVFCTLIIIKQLILNYLKYIPGSPIFNNPWGKKKKKTRNKNPKIMYTNDRVYVY